MVRSRQSGSSGHRPRCVTGRISACGKWWPEGRIVPGVGARVAVGQPDRLLEKTRLLPGMDCAAAAARRKR